MSEKEVQVVDYENEDDEDALKMLEIEQYLMEGHGNDGDLSNAEYDDIEAELHKDDMCGKHEVISADYWYPESKDCTCCSGFKYGCPSCSASGYSECASCCASGSPKLRKTSQSSPPKYPYGAAQATSSGNYGNHGNSYSGVPECVFFKQGRCMYGDSCRYRHCS